jgi:flagellar protein FliS
MYGNGSGIDMYKRTNVTTADPLSLVLMCYDGAIRNLKIARERHVSQDYEAKAKAVQKVQDALSLLIQSLDFEKGGEIASRLNSLYTYMARRIVEGDLQRDVKAFDEVISMLEELESGWKEIDSARQDPSCHRDERTSIAGAY